MKQRVSKEWNNLNNLLGFFREANKHLNQPSKFCLYSTLFFSIIALNYYII